VANPLALGIDPDTKALAWALADRHTIYAVGVVRSSSGSVSEMLRNASLAIPTIRSAEIAVVESQEIHYQGKAPPADILKLAHVAGGILGILSAVCPTTKLCLPVPREWKGQVPKPIHHKRIFQHYGILAVEEREYCRPAGCSKIAQVVGASALKNSDWKHVTDAIGLARFGADLVHSGLVE